MATSRPSLLSRARYTSPIPPAPICARTSYEPRRVPEVKAITCFLPVTSALVPRSN